MGKTFGQSNGIRRYNIQDLDTPYGRVFAYQIEFKGKQENERFTTVCFPLIRSLPPEEGCAVEIGDFVPPEQLELTCRILREEGYLGEIKWKPGEGGRP